MDYFSMPGLMGHELSGLLGPELNGFGLTGIGLMWVAVHLFGLAAAWMVRLHDGRRFAALVQGSFFASLLAVAITTIIGHECCLEMWPLSGLTLAVMIVVAILDLGVSQPSAAWLES